ncbi:MAG TPA: response regulator transcription factor [Flavipsychrobacter sp.]|nr:response regulator transcription factor [Flavipsychrobacter sp.]
MKIKILYIEDEVHLAKIVSDTLRLKNYEVLHKEDGSHILDDLKIFSPDVCLFDVMLPHIDGFSLGNVVRNLHPHLPIIFITAKSQTQDVVEGFLSGGTDYIRKPFSMEELMVRIDNQVTLSRKKNEATALKSDVPLGKILYSPLKMELKTPQRVIKLSNREAEILNMLCMHQNQTIERRKLLQLIWGDDSFFNSRNLDVYIKKLRDYFNDVDGVEVITLKSVGYYFSVPVQQ